MKIVLSIIVILMTLENASGRDEISFDSELNKCKSVVDKYKDFQTVYKNQMLLKDEIIEDCKSSNKILLNNITRLQHQIEGFEFKENFAEHFEKSITSKIEQINLVNASLIETEKNLNSCDQKTSALEEQLNSNKAELNAKIIEINELSVTIKQQNDRIQALEKEISLGNANRQESINQIHNLESSLKSCADESKGKNQENEELKTQINTNAVEIKNLDEIIASYSSCCKANSCEPFGISSSVHAIQVPGVPSGPFKVLCNGELNGPGWTIIQRRMDGSVSFYRNWTEYRNGFGELSGEFFIGLEKLHHMTTAAPQELYVHLEDFEGQTRYAKYDNFEVGSEEESYVLKSLGSHAGNLSDAMRLNEGEKFTTFDRKNDRNSKNCAEHLSGAWWYGKCGLINLNGLYQIADLNYDTANQGIFWDDDNWHDFEYSFKTVHLMIRAKKAPAVTELYRQKSQHFE